VCFHPYKLYNIAKSLYNSGAIIPGIRLTAYRKFILEKMVKHGWIGGKHTNEENIPKGKPRDEYKDVFKELDKLKKEGFFILRKKPDGLHLSINPRMMPLVRQMLEEELGG